MDNYDFELEQDVMMVPEGDPNAFVNAGLNLVAYTRTVDTPEGIGIAIHAANGEQFAIAPDEASAYGFIKQNDMEPVRLH